MATTAAPDLDALAIALPVPVGGRAITHPVTLATFAHHFERAFPVLDVELEVSPARPVHVCDECGENPEGAYLRYDDPTSGRSVPQHLMCVPCAVRTVDQLVADRVEWVGAWLYTDQAAA